MIGLATCSWRAYHHEMDVAVRITLGMPPPLCDHPHEEVGLLAPPLKEFRKAYRNHCQRVTARGMRQEFEVIAQGHHGSGSCSCASRPTRRTATAGCGRCAGLGTSSPGITAS